GTTAALYEPWPDPAMKHQWIPPAPEDAVDASADPVVGGRFRVVMKGRGREIVHVGEYLVIDRPTRLVFTWNSEPAGDTTVTVEFMSLGARRTRIRLTHERFATGESRDLHRGGWTALLDSLDTVFQPR